MYEKGNTDIICLKYFEYLLFFKNKKENNKEKSLKKIFS